MNAPSNGSNGVDTSTSSSQHGKHEHDTNHLMQKSLPGRRRSRSKGTISGFGSPSKNSSNNKSIKSLDASSHHSPDSNHSSSANQSPPGSSMPPPLTSDSSNPNQPLHHDAAVHAQNSHSKTHTPPRKPCYSAKLALVSVQNASYMGARTQIQLCPPGKARNDLLKAIQTRKRKKKPTPIRRSLSFQRAASINSVGSRVEETSAIEKVLGESGVAEYHHEEEKFLSNPDLRKGEMNSDGDEILEDPSSGDNDDLDYLFDDEVDAHMSSKAEDENGHDSNNLEPLYCGADAVSDMRGSANSGKIAFNFRKIKWFDSVCATDRATARQYLKNEIKNMKRREIKALTGHLKRLQRREKRRMEIESGRRRSMGAVSDKLYNDEEAEDSSNNVNNGLGCLPSPMTPSLSAALVLESLSHNPLESIEGMSKCYEGIVAAGSALLDSKIDETPSLDKKIHSKDEIINALAPLLITTLEQESGDTIVALAKLRKSCGTRRYQRRFVQRIAPCLVRPPNAAMWCLRHQQDMESIIAATELILDKSSEIFRKEWYERGQTILADSKRAETLKAAAMQLKNLSTTNQPSDRLMKGLQSKKGFQRSRSGSLHQHNSKDLSNNVMAEWEILAVDAQIRDSINNLFTKGWNRVVITNAPPRDGEPQSKKLRGISAKSKSAPTPENDNISVSSSDQSQYVSSPPRLSHHSPILPNTNQFASPVGSRKSPAAPSDLSHMTSKHKDFKRESYRIESFDPTSPPQTPRNDAESVATPPRSPPHGSSYQHSPRSNQLSPTRYSDNSHLSPVVESSRTPAPLSPVNSYRRQHESGHQLFSNSTTGTSANAQNMYLRTLTSTAAERKRTVAACRALRAQIARFEEAFIKMHGRPPKGQAERAPLATTYAQYREWKRAIRADAASRIQALARGASVRSYLSQDPRFREIIRKRAGRPKKAPYSHLSLPEGLESKKTQKMQSQTLAPIPRRADGSVEIVMGPSSGFSKRSISDTSFDNSTLNSSQFPSTMSNVSGTSSFKQEISHFSHAQLQAQKRELKQELKKYDLSFFNRHGRMPIKAEKEPIRHLYEKYNQLKNRITAVERDPSLIQQPQELPQQQPAPVSSSRRKKNKPMVSSHSIDVGSHSSNSSNHSNTSGEDTQSNVHNSQTRSRPDSYKRTPTSPGSQQDIGALKTEKQALHQMLRSYEKDFYKKYNRQVSSYADIRPVASQYRRYKEIKKQILALQASSER